jgi:hypothetical protein
VFFACVILDRDPPIYASCIAGMTSTHCHAISFYYFYFLRWTLVNFLPRLASNHDPSDLCFSSYWDYRHEPLLPASFFLLTLSSNLPKVKCKTLARSQWLTPVIPASQEAEIKRIEV